jgi:DNA-binding transcriptional ArsR family regulator
MRLPDSAGLIELSELADWGSPRFSPVHAAPNPLPRKSKEASLDPRLIKALGHPVRVGALAILNERVASPSELAKELGESLGNVAYHVKVLEENDAIELVRTAPVRGALEHFYRASVDTQITQVPLDLDQQGYDEVVELVGSVTQRAREIQEQSADRTAKSPGDGAKHRTALITVHVHRADA